MLGVAQIARTDKNFEVTVEAPAKFESKCADIQESKVVPVLKKLNKTILKPQMHNIQLEALKP